MAFESKRLLRPPPAVPMRTIVAKDEEVQRIQRNVQEATEKVRAQPSVKSRRVTVTATAPGPVTFSHGLGRKPSGYKVLNRSAAADDFLVNSTSRLLTIDVSAAAVLVIEVE